MKKVILIVLIFFAIVVFSGCNFNKSSCNTNKYGSKKQGELYTLSEAYEKHYITKNDLIEIKNNYKNSDNKLVLDKIIESKILNDVLLGLKKTIKDAKIEDVYIFGYYGNFNNSYVIRVSDTFSDYPAVMEELNIDGILFEYSGPNFLVWISK